MNQRMYYSVVLFTLLAIAGQGCASGGRTVTIFRSDAAPVMGELIGVRDGCLLLDTVAADGSTTTKSVKKSEVPQSPAKILAPMEYDKMDSIRIEAENHLVDGLIVGLAVAGITAFIAAATPEKKNEGLAGVSGDPGGRALLASLVFGAPAILLFTSIGALNSSSESMIHPSGLHRDELGHYARYRDKEPIELTSTRCSTRDR